MRASVGDRVIDVVSRFTSVPKRNISGASSLRDDLAVSSFDMVCIMTAVEDELSLDLGSLGDVSNLETVGDVVNCVQGQVERTRPSGGADGSQAGERHDSKNRIV